MNYFLGVDIGSTKSHALIADAQGRALGFGQGGPGNWESLGWQGAGAVLREIVSQALRQAGIGREEIAGAGFGLAGYDWPEDRAGHEALVESLHLSRAACILGNDTLVGLVAGAEAGWGVVVVAGTSNNCRGRDRQGREGRVTGMGSWFGEYGGAGELVSRALHAVAAAWTCRGPATALGEAFVHVAGARDVSDLLAGLVRGRYRLHAAQAPLVFEAAAAGDGVAEKLITWAGEELASLALGVIRQLQLQEEAFDVVLSGSLYNGGPLLVGAMESVIWDEAPRARLVRLQAPPVTGGVLLGMEAVGQETGPIRARLMESANRLTES